MVMFGNIPREKIPWHPTIDYDKCVGCKQCYEFCKNGVFEWDEEKNQPMVKNPTNCVINCVACAKLCPQEAISFPSKAEIERIVAEYTK